MEQDHQELGQTQLGIIRLGLVRDINALRHDLTALGTEVMKNAQEVKQLVEQECKKRDAASLQLKERARELDHPNGQGMSHVREQMMVQQDAIAKLECDLTQEKTCRDGQQDAIHGRLLILERSIQDLGNPAHMVDKLEEDMAEVQQNFSDIYWQISDERAAREEHIDSVRNLLERPTTLSERDNKLMDLVALQQDAMTKVQRLVNEEKSVRDIQQAALQGRIDKLERSTPLRETSQSRSASPERAVSVPAEARVVRSSSVQPVRPVSMTSPPRETMERRLFEPCTVLAPRKGELAKATILRSPAQAALAQPSPVVPARQSSPLRSPPCPPLRGFQRVPGETFDQMDCNHDGAVPAAEMRPVMPITTPPRADLISRCAVGANSPFVSGSPPRAGVFNQRSSQIPTGLRPVAVAPPSRASKTLLTRL